MFIDFLGATQTVTGSKYLLKADKKTILVDCGLFQGQKPLRLRNRQPLPINSSQIDIVLLTHAHIDHSGYIPLLVKNGFRGKILCTEATLSLCRILLPDSGHLHEEEAMYANRRGYSKHHPALPLYTKLEAEASLAYFETIPFGKYYSINETLSCQFHRAGHILGAASIQVNHHDTSLLFSGDLGREHDPILYPPAKPQNTDYLVLESTYGDTLHDKSSPQEKLGEIINQTIKHGGKIIMPAFAVGRAQQILYYLHQLITSNTIPTIPIYIDSPMATNTTKLLIKHNTLHRLKEEEAIAVCKTAHYVQSIEESMEIDNQPMPSVIISASGMITGGRILHHLNNLASTHRNTLVFTGFQAQGTRGAHILEGAKQVKLFGRYLPIKAKVCYLSNTSAHADYEEILEWLSYINKPPRKIFITHGEPSASLALKEKIEERFNWSCIIPDYLHHEELV
jgi:metallo-beta-lactamase family protein